MTAAVDNQEDDEVWNTVAVASVALQQEMQNFSRALWRGREAGMSFRDLCDTSGMSESWITQLLLDFQ